MVPVAVHSQNNQDVDTSTLASEDGYWSRVYYTKNFLPGYPEYFPLVIGVQSKGSLPRDVAKHINYTNTVFIGNLDIQSNLTIPQFQDEGGIYRTAAQHDLIGTKTLYFKFAVYSLPENATKIHFEFRLEPFNLSHIVANDLFDVYVNVKHEANGHDFLLYFGITVIPFFVLVIERGVFYPKLNKYYLQNLRFWPFVFHIYHIRYVVHQIKYHFRILRSRD